MAFSRIIVLGAGAIGSIYAASLSTNNDVQLVGRQAHVNAIASKGLKLLKNGEETISLRADTAIHEIPRNALVILTTKAHDSEKAIEKIKDKLMRDTTILILQNGLGNKKTLMQKTDHKAEILRGLTSMAAEYLGPGEIRFWDGETIIEQNTTSRKISQVFNESGLKTTLTSEISAEIWKKAVLNCIVNPLSAVLQVRNNQLLSESLRSVREQVITECTRVARAEGVQLPENLSEEISQKIGRYSNFSSMSQDLTKRKKTEIDFLNGKIVELGIKHRIPTPVNKTLVALIRFMEENYAVPREN